MEISTRKLSVNTDGAFLLCLPRWWCKNRRLRKGDFVTVELDGEDLRIRPAKKSKIRGKK